MKKTQLHLKWVFILFLSGILLCSCRNNREIPLIGLADDGTEKIEYLPYTGYTKESSKFLNEIGSHAIESLNYVELKNNQRVEAPPWELKSFVIGLTLAAGIGIGQLGIEGQGTLYLFFEKNK